MQRQGGCHSHGKGSKRDFIIAEYHRDGVGEWCAPIPASAPCGPGCRIKEHASRGRVTGPKHPLIVVICETHKQSFTLYPPGFLPYGRKRLVPQQSRWDATVFQAAVDAEEGERWSEIGGSEAWWPTQWRQIGWAGEVLGLRSSAEVGERVSRELGLSLHEHRDARSAFAQGGFRERGRVVMRVLRATVQAGGDVLRRLLRAGHLVGLFGRAFRWNTRGGLMPMVTF